jgi:hypothetical protein
MLLHILLLFLFSSSAVVAVPAGVSSGAGHTRRIGSGSGSNAINHAPEEIFPLFGELPTRAVGMTWYRVLIEVSKCLVLIDESHPCYTGRQSGTTRGMAQRCYSFS